MSTVEQSLKTQEEVQRLITRIINSTIIILQRRDKEQTKKLKELHTALSIDLTDWNNETIKILKQKWRKS